MRIVKRGGEAPTLCETVVYGQLAVLLSVVIGLVGIKDGIFITRTVCHGILAGRVITAVSTVAPVRHIVRHAFPSHACLFGASESTKDDLRFLAVPADVTVVTVQVAIRAIEETVGVDFGETGVHHPSIADRGMCLNHLTEGVVHTAVEGQCKTAHGVQHVCLHIQRCAERC